MIRALHILIVLFLIPFPGQVISQPVSVGIAGQAALSYCLRNKSIRESSGAELPQITHSWSMEKDGENIFHVFKLAPEGFIILSSDKRITPVLGYSTSGYFGENEMPPGCAQWSDDVIMQISMVKKGEWPADPDAQGKWDMLLSGSNEEPAGRSSFVLPLLTSTWNQGTYYNELCPASVSGPGGHVYAGCVAIAMAQVMFYHQHPQTGNDSVSYYLSGYDSVRANFEKTTYNWLSMVNSIHQAANPSVAELVFHCGASVHTSYSPNGSGASTIACENALRYYFHYDPEVRYVNRSETGEGWNDTIRSDLDNGWPVLYRSGSLGSGHCFVCDGYDEDGLFHFNWGWGGACNGYFQADAITPGGYDLTAQQAAVIHIRPDPDHVVEMPDTCLLVSPAGTITDGSGFRPYDSDLNRCWLIKPEDASLENIQVVFDRFETQAGHDFLEVFDGDDTLCPMVGVFSGDEIPPALTASSGSMLLRFRSDSSVEAKGFTISYIAYEEPFSQGFNFPGGWQGIISDGSGPYNYANCTDAYWLLEPENPDWDSISHMWFNIEFLDTQPGHDRLLFHDGPGPGDRVIADISGYEATGTFYSTSNRVLVHFISDDSLTGAGWTISYGSVLPEYCQETVHKSEVEGIITDGSGPVDYNPDTYCTWVIESERAEGFIISFTQFGIEYGYDRLSIFDISGRFAELMADFTGNQLPEPVYLVSSKLLVVFETDATINGPGWELHYAAQMTGIPDQEPISIEVRPNPVRDILHIITESTFSGERIRYELTDLAGRPYPVSGYMRSDGVSLLMKGLPAGIYILSVSEGNRVFTKKIMKMADQ